MRFVKRHQTVAASQLTMTTPAALGFTGVAAVCGEFFAQHATTASAGLKTVQKDSKRQRAIYDMETKQCSECSRTLPTEKFNQESDAPDVCFGCRVKTVNIGFGGNRESWHGDALVGGTIASDNRHTVAEARSNGYNPVPVKNGESSWTPSASNINKLKTALGG